MYESLNQYERYNDLVWLCEKKNHNTESAKHIPLFEYMIFRKIEKTLLSIKSYET